MKKALLDTNILSYFLRGDAPIVERLPPLPPTSHLFNLRHSAIAFISSNFLSQPIKSHSLIAPGTWIMPTPEQQAIAKNLKLLREQLAGLYDTWTTIAPEEKVRIQQLIDRKQTEIRYLEQQLSGAIADEAKETAVKERENFPISAKNVGVVVTSGSIVRIDTINVGDK